MKRIIKCTCLLVLIFTLLCGTLVIEAKSNKASKGSNASFQKTVPAVSVQGSIVNDKNKPVVEVSWSKIKGAKGYRIYKKNKNGKYKLLKTVNAKSTSVFIKRGKDVNIGTYYVRAYKVVKGKKVYSKFGHNKYVYE